jgi:hypothetical protein
VQLLRRNGHHLSPGNHPWLELDLLLRRSHALVPGLLRQRDLPTALRLVRQLLATELVRRRGQKSICLYALGGPRAMLNSELIGPAVLCAALAGYSTAWSP